MSVRHKQEETTGQRWSLKRKSDSQGSVRVRSDQKRRWVRKWWTWNGKHSHTFHNYGWFRCVLISFKDHQQTRQLTIEKCGERERETRRPFRKILTTHLKDVRTEADRRRKKYTLKRKRIRRLIVLLRELTKKQKIVSWVASLQRNYYMHSGWANASHYGWWNKKSTEDSIRRDLKKHRVSGEAAANLFPVDESCLRSLNMDTRYQPYCHRNETFEQWRENQRSKRIVKEQWRREMRRRNAGRARRTITNVSSIPKACISEMR